MHRLARVLACAVVAAVVAGCSSDGEPPASSGSGSAPPITSRSQPPGPTNGVTGTPTAEPTVFATADRMVEPPPEPVALRSVRTERDGAVERIVIDVTGDTVPGVSARYVDVVRLDDDPILTDGSAALELLLRAADPNGPQGADPDVAVELAPHYPILREVKYVRFLAGEVLYAIGISDQVPYRVITGNSRIVIEFKG